MQLLPDFVRTQIPPLHSREGNSDPLVVCRFFLSGAGWTWYVIEGESVMGDGKEIDFEFFGLVEGFEVELGYFSLGQLHEAQRALGVVVERDLYFKQCRLSQVRGNLLERR